jgi:hypothetical protein
VGALRLEEAGSGTQLVEEEQVLDTQKYSLISTIVDRE